MLTHAVQGGGDNSITTIAAGMDAHKLRGRRVAEHILALPPIFGTTTTTATTTTDDGVNNQTQQLRHHHQDSEDYDCTLDISVGCTVRSTQLMGEVCETFVPPVLPVNTCHQTPLTTTLLYNGGNCTQSDNIEALGYVCQDSKYASPPTQIGELSYIVVTDSYHQNIVYYQGWVRVGSRYVLGNGEPMKYGIFVHIYSSEDRSNLLQAMAYPASLCTSELELLGRFGASQVVGYTNEKQGIVLPFASYTYDATVEVTISLPPGSLSSGGVTLESLTLLSSSDGFYDLTPLVKGRSILPFAPLEVSLPMELDVRERRSHTLLTRVSARHDQGTSGGICQGIDYYRLRTGGRTSVA